MASMRRAPSRRIRSDHRGALFGAAALLSVCAAGDASAQFVYGYASTYSGPVYGEDLPPIPPRAVVYRLRDRGFTEIDRPRFDGRAYIVEATNPAGDRVRLFVDAREGGVLGRQRLDTPYYPSRRVARAAPGYGWTEEDAAPRRAGRDSEGLLPPGDIPLPRPSLHAEIDRAPTVIPRGSVGPGGAGPFGVNPDARGSRAEAAQGDKARASSASRKSARLTPPVKPANPRTAPEAPAPQIAPGAAPEAAAMKAEPAPVTPAANQPAATPSQSFAKPADKASGDAPAQDRRSEEKPVAEKAPGDAKAAPGWQDPPASEARRNVRVIGGATVVPGGEAAPSGAN